MFREMFSNFGCCGYSWNFKDEPISLFGTVDSKEEAEAFVKACEEAVSRIHPKYPYPKPVYWTFKIPDNDIYIVSYQVSNNTHNLYTPREYSKKTLVFDISYDTYKLEKILVSPQLIDKYKKPEKRLPPFINKISSFFTDFETFKAIVSDRRQFPLSLCVFHHLYHPQTKAMIDLLKTKYEILFEQMWHNPCYEMPGKELDIKDRHTLLTVIFKEKV